MTRCVSGTVVGFLLPMCMCLSFAVAWFLVYWLGTAKRRKAKTAYDQLLKEKDAFKDKEIETHLKAVKRYSDEAARWRQEAEVNRAASDSYKRLLDAHGVKYERQTMLFHPSESIDGDTLKVTQ